MIRSGVVTTGGDEHNHPHLQGDTAQVYISLCPEAGCGHCAAAGGCGIRLFNSAEEHEVVLCEAPNDLPLRHGDKVDVKLSMGSKHWLYLLLLAYGLPTIGMLVGTLAATWLVNMLELTQYNALFTLTGFAAGLAGGLLAWSRLYKPDQGQRGCDGEVVRLQET